MTGFLHRLAERAAGVAHPLRKAAPGLYSPPRLDEAQPMEMAIDAVVDARPTRPPNGRAPTSQPGQTGAPAVSMTSAGRNQTLGQHVEDAVDHAVAARPPAGVVPAETSPRAQRPQTRMTDSPRPGQLHAAGKEDTASDARSRPDFRFESTADMPAELPESLLLASVAAARIEPLLPPVSPERGHPLPHTGANFASQMCAAAGVVEETTEVHVSIGRIEVTAVHEPAPAKPAAPRRNAPMSLDDYLAKRHGGRS